MFKGIIFLTFFCISISAQVQYDPATGEPLDQKKYNPNTGEKTEQRYDPNTGESLEVKKGGMTAKIVLKTGSIIQGKLVSQDREKIILKSQASGTLSIDRAKIEKITIGGIPMSSRRSISPTVVDGSTSTDNIFKTQNLDSIARREARVKNNQLYNALVGTGACINPVPFITLPVMSIAIIGNVGVPDPSGKFYKDLDLKSKKTYKTIYKREFRKLRMQQCYTPTLVAASTLFLLIFTG